MENLFDAVMMIGAILMFLIGLSFGVYMYNRVLDANDKILTMSEYYDKTAEHFTVNEVDSYERRIPGAEIINQYYDMIKGNSFAYQKIVVDGLVLNKPTSFNPATNDNLRNNFNAISTRTYKVNSVGYDTDGRVISITYVHI